MDDDATLLERWRDGDGAAGEQLLKRHFRSVYVFFANKIGGQVDDLIQDTFESCLRSVDGLREGGSFRAYLLTIARRRLYAEFRKRPGIEAFDSAVVSVEQLMSSPSVLIARDQNQRLLLLALRSIPVELQIILELSYWEQMSSKDIAVVLEIPTGTVKSRVRRAKEALAACFEALASGGAKNVEQATHDDLERWARSLRADLDARLGLPS